MAIHDVEGLQQHVTAAPVLRRDAKPSEAQICGYFNQNENYSVYCPGTSTCSTPLGGKSWGCCDTAVCYVPATCEDGGATYCGGTPSSRCTRTPIMQCTYGASSRCVAFVRQTASDDPSKLTSWGCQPTTTTYIIDPPVASRTNVALSGTTAATVASTASSATISNGSGGGGKSASSGLSTDGKIILGVLLPVLGITALVGLFFYLRRRNRAKPDGEERSQQPQDRGDTRMISEPKPPASTTGVVHEVENGERPAELHGNETTVKAKPLNKTPRVDTKRKVYEMGVNER
ncbi:hypothetical protein EDB80DRAFT_895680 [Ilyonectria destructans]|nr:hypothetical protein EDB80DRAFT_895680 [Ilyonectria destructans]